MAFIFYSFSDADLKKIIMDAFIANVATTELEVNSEV